MDGVRSISTTRGPLRGESFLTAPTRGSVHLRVATPRDLAGWRLKSKSEMPTAAVYSRFTETPPEVIEAIHPTPRRLRSTAVSSIVLPLGPPVRGRKSARHWRVAEVLSSRRCIAWEEQVMTIATTSSTARQSVLKHVPKLALALAGIAVVLLALGPIGWRLGWWHFRFSLLTLMPWAAYVGLAAVIVSALALVIGLSRLVVRVAPANSGSRIDLRSSSRYGRSDFGVNAERVRDYLTALRAATTSQG